MKLWVIFHHEDGPVAVVDSEEKMLSICEASDDELDSEQFELNDTTTADLYKDEPIPVDAEEIFERQD